MTSRINSTLESVEKGDTRAIESAANDVWRVTKNSDLFGNNPFYPKPINISIDGVPNVTEIWERAKPSFERIAVNTAGVAVSSAAAGAVAGYQMETARRAAVRVDYGKQQKHYKAYQEMSKSQMPKTSAMYKDIFHTRVAQKGVVGAMTQELQQMKKVPVYKAAARGAVVAMKWATPVGAIVSAIGELVDSSPAY